MKKKEPKTGDTIIYKGRYEIIRGAVVGIGFMLESNGHIHLYQFGDDCWDWPEINLENK